LKELDAIRTLLYFDEGFFCCLIHKL
jgi:hypothetical protein